MDRFVHLFVLLDEITTLIKSGYMSNILDLLTYIYLISGIIIYLYI